MKLKNKPELEFIELLIVNIFDLTILNFEFIRSEISENKIIDNFHKHSDIIKYYYPNYFYNEVDTANFNKIITILNHFLNEYNYKIYKKETTYNKKKLYKYYIMSINHNHKTSIQIKNTVISLK
tara:strand:+ start:95 stop:466 length:372 start_codon:yes stop_codon:yes gene_type:complete